MTFKTIPAHFTDCFDISKVSGEDFLRLCAIRERGDLHITHIHHRFGGQNGVYRVQGYIKPGLDAWDLIHAYAGRRRLDVDLDTDLAPKNEVVWIREIEGGGQKETVWRPKRGPRTAKRVVWASGDAS